MNTSTTINVIKWISVIGGAIAGLFGAWDDALTYLLVLNAVDFASGLVCAFRGKSHKTESGCVSSGVVFDGVARKAYMWLIVLLAAALAWLFAESVLQARPIPALTKALRTALPLAVLAGVCYNFCVYFAAEPQLMGQNPALYENVSRLVQFWL